MSNTNSAHAHVPICPRNHATNPGPLSIDDALTLRDIQDRACSIERLLYAWPNDDKGNVERIKRPTRRNVLNGPEAPGEKTADHLPVFCRSDADDAYLLMLQLQRPEDQVAELHRVLQHLFAGRIGHLKPSDRRLMRMQSVLWPGANESASQEIIDVVVRFHLFELSAAEVRRIVSIAHRIVLIAQRYVAEVESMRLALANNDPLPNLDRPVDQLESSPEWFEFEAPGPANAPWRA